MTKHWLDTKEYPFSSKFFSVNNHKLHYVDEGKGDVILFVHGTPSWSFDYRHCIKALSKTNRCIAIDHIGFGLSDKPTEYDYSTQNHSASLERFIIENKLTNITLVVHDFGGPIGLSVTLNQPERIKKIVVINSWLWSSKEDADFIKFSKILKSPLLPVLYKYFNFSARYLLPKSFGDKKISKSILKHYTKPFSNKYERSGPLAFAKSLLNDQDWFEELWNEREVITNKPTLFIWGMKDSFVKPHYLEKFKQGFPKASVVELGTCGHFPQEEESEKVIEALKIFIAN